MPKKVFPKLKWQLYQRISKIYKKLKSHISHTNLRFELNFLHILQSDKNVEMLENTLKYINILCSASKLKWDKLYSPDSSTELEGVTNQAAKRSKFMSVGSARFVQKKSWAVAHTEILCFNLRFVGYWPAHASRTRLHRLEADVKTTLFN